MSDDKEVVALAAGETPAVEDIARADKYWSKAVKKRDPKAELERIRTKNQLRYARIVAAATHFADSDADLERLSERDRRIAMWAREDRRSVPFGIVMAHEKEIAAARADAKKPELNLSLSITGNGAQTAVVLPPMATSPDGENVKVVEVDATEDDRT